jgi:hypothetical protein
MPASGISRIASNLHSDLCCFQVPDVSVLLLEVLTTKSLFLEQLLYDPAQKHQPRLSDIYLKKAVDPVLSCLRIAVRAQSAYSIGTGRNEDKE